MVTRREGGARAVERMAAALAHRGPDDRGTAEIPCGETRVWLGATRLAILDLSPAGHQPMHDAATGNWIVYNGEVYNFAELRAELERRGAAFRSRTDTEVVLQAYAAWGTAAVERLRGMFALAVWDAAKRELFLARDRLGKKPLYYAARDEGFLFASEVRALLASGWIRRRLDPQALEIYLANGFLVSPLTVLAEARSLLPGHWMRVGAGGGILETRRYWRLPALESGRQREERLSEAREKAEVAVRLRLASDVPLGAFLSGGLDSSTIVALMQRGGAAARTFSVAFDEPEYDESRYSRWVAGRFGAQHTEVKLTRAGFYELLPAALAAMDQPSYDGVNTFCVAQAARQSGLKVALSGLGADELFGGYPFFNTARRLARLRRWLPARALVAARYGRDRLFGGSLRGLSGAGKAAEIFCASGNGDDPAQALAAYQTTQVLFPGWARGALDGAMAHNGRAPAFYGLPAEFVAALREETDGCDADTALSRLALRLFLGERCLRDTDAMSMAVSLEVRAPFTDQEFVGALSTWPGRERLAGAPDKLLMQKLVRPVLGESYPWRAKRGFVFPFAEWLQDRCFFEALWQRAASAEQCRAAGLAPQVVAELGRRFERGQGVPWSRPWALAVFLDWCRRHEVTL